MLSKIPLLSRNFWQKFVKENSHNFRNVTLTVWKLRTFTATIFSLKFREINFVLKKFTLGGFDEKKFTWHWISLFPHYDTATAWWFEKFSPFEFFREIILQKNSLVLKLVWRKKQENWKYNETMYIIFASNWRTYSINYQIELLIIDWYFN